MVVQTSQLNNLEEEANKETAPQNNSDNFSELIKKNIELSEEILKISKKVNNFMIWQRIFSLLKLLIIVVPLILGYYYLLPYVQELQSAYSELLGLKDTAESVNSIDLNSISPDIINKFLK